MTKLASLSFFSISVFVILSACSQSSDDKGATQLKTAPNEFVFVNGAEPESLDPHRISAHDAAQLTMQMHEALLSRAADYKTIIPGLAESWSISPDGKTYKFVIREGLKWSNGEAMTIQQIRDSFVRALNPALGGQYTYWHTNYIQGAKAVFENFDATDRQKYIDALGVKIIDERNLEIHLIKPVAFFKYLLSQPVFNVIHPSMADPSSPAWTDPARYVTSSAYKLREWAVNRKVVMERNPHYHDANNVGLDRIVALPTNDETTTFNLYRSGELDWSGRNTISSQLVPTLKSRPDFQIQTGLATYMFLFNTKKEPFTDARVRRAFSLVIDRALITDKVLRNGATPSKSIVPGVIEGYATKVPVEAPEGERIAEAKNLLAEAGFEDVSKFPKVTIRYNTREAHHKIAQSLQQMWKQKLGIEVGLENMEWKVFLKETEAGNFDIARQGWIGDYPDPSTFLEIFTSSSENNRARYSNPKFDELVAKAVTINDDQERFEILSQAEKVLYDDAPAFGVYNYTDYGLLRPEVQGFVPNYQGHYYFRYLTKKVDADQKAEL